MLSMWSIIKELYQADQDGKSEKDIDKIKNKYYERIYCSGFYSKDWGEELIQIDSNGIINKVTAYTFAIENYKTIYEAMIQHFNDVMSPIIYEATHKDGDISFDSSGNKQVH